MKIVFDVDGTICFNGQYIDELLIKKIKEISKKYDVIFASARPIRDLIPVVKDFKNEILIGGNGSIVSKESRVEVIKRIPIFEYSIIKELIKKYKLNYIIDGAFDYSSNVNTNNKIYRQLDPDNLANKVEMKEIKEPIKIILIDIPDNIFVIIKKFFSKSQYDISVNYHHNENNIDITAKGINKLSTLKRIIGDESFIAYGNDVNDFEVLKNAYKGFYVSDKDVNLPFNITEIVNCNSSSIIKSLKKHIKGE
ncbi:HAD family hydrolase [Staphylococcus epidermidis]|uniref:HAD-IIB family hydrolase n=1 Tax=Staphylococcus epidermidis TaxID=1282 RepID=UPI00066BCA55|nr:HAD-IIB family hydrolase [Staphylococcus epidermidis]MCG1058210.1 HAD family hydrolase [Staphylococcus epidermidis]MCG1123601.1 HAD family hydrolase [Staphylococcus epidermidis]MCG1256834.1 HAD family hydrolase [Staphylococcus epidermidis]MCG1259208.1 HAD family hydrolase [Staphylococcus epidermidis]MCG1261356.1 HAD family hydrolase [Staphylococcus epidermidis]